MKERLLDAESLKDNLVSLETIRNQNTLCLYTDK